MHSTYGKRTLRILLVDSYMSLESEGFVKNMLHLVVAYDWRFKQRAQF